MELSLEYGIDAPMFRPVNSFGDKTYPDQPTSTIRVAYLLGAPYGLPGNGGAFSNNGRLYVYRGTDIQDGDKVRLPEGDFIVMGKPQNNMVNPLDGNNFGVMRFQIERG